MRESTEVKKDNVPWVVENKSWEHLNTTFGNLGPIDRGGTIMMRDNKRKQKGHVRAFTDATDAGYHTSVFQRPEKEYSHPQSIREGPSGI